MSYFRKTGGGGRAVDSTTRGQKLSTVMGGFNYPLRCDCYAVAGPEEDSMPVAEKTIAEQLLPEFDAEYGLTRKFLALVPDDKTTWKPHEKSMELGRLAWHLSDFPSWCRDTLNKDVLAFNDAEGEKMKGEWKNKTHEDMLTRFDA